MSDENQNSNDSKSEVVRALVRALEEAGMPKKNEQTQQNTSDENSSMGIVMRAASKVQKRHEQDPIVIESTSKPDKIDVPVVLQQFFDGDIDLDMELAGRFESMPVMSIFKARTMGKNKRRGVATISTPDGAAQLIVDADRKTRVIHLSFTLGAMLTLRFTVDELGQMDKQRWLELMRRDQGGLAFLWGPSRWEKDYLISVVRRYYTNLYAFSPTNFQAGVRLTPDVTENLLKWLEEFWQYDEREDDQPPQLLTW